MLTIGRRCMQLPGPAEDPAGTPDDAFLLLASSERLSPLETMPQHMLVEAADDDDAEALAVLLPPEPLERILARCSNLGIPCRRSPARAWGGSGSASS